MPSTQSQAVRTEHYSRPIIKKVIDFLKMLMPETMAKRIICIILLSIGVVPDEVASIAGFCVKTVKSIQNKIHSNELDALFIIRGGGRKSSIAEFEDDIIEEINKNHYHSQQQIADMIQERYSIKLTPQAIGKFLKKKGIHLLKCGSLPAKANPEEQRIFNDTLLQPLMRLAKNNTVALLFVDASHFVMGCDFLGRIYGTVRRFIRTGSGRKRYNVLGALNFFSKKLTTITNDAYITSTQVCELLEKIAIEYAGKPIYLVLDNASYQKCNIVRELAKKLNINLVYIPPYSPNLNLIERYWKFVKSKLRIKYYSDFGEFRNKIDEIIQLSDSIYRQDLDRLISSKVQLFDNMATSESNPCVSILEVPQTHNVAA